MDGLECLISRAIEEYHTICAVILNSQSKNKKKDAIVPLIREEAAERAEHRSFHHCFLVLQHPPMACTGAPFARSRAIASQREFQTMKVRIFAHPLCKAWLCCGLENVPPRPVRGSSETTCPYELDQRWTRAPHPYRIIATSWVTEERKYIVHSAGK